VPCNYSPTLGGRWKGREGRGEEGRGEKGGVFHMNFFGGNQGEPGGEGKKEKRKDKNRLIFTG